MEDEVFDIETLLQNALSGDKTQIGIAINELMSGRQTELPDSKLYLDQLNPANHDIMDRVKRPDKMVNIDENSPEYGSTRSIMVNQDGAVPEKCKIEPVARIALAIQKLIVNRAVGITFGNAPKYRKPQVNEQEQALYDAVIRVLKDNKESTLNRKVAKHIYGLTEAAERWYVTEGKDLHTNYSDTPTRNKIRVQVFSPQYGDVLYPYFDDNRDMTAFSRMFTRKDSKGNKHTYFETYTADTFYLWVSSGDNSASNAKNGAWEMMEGYPKPNPYGKIPVIYGRQDKPEFADVQSLIDRLEKLLSNFADTNDYHSSPKIVVKGHVNSFCKKGEAGAILELDPDADAQYLAWNQAPEAVKAEYDYLKQMIHMITQTPDLSWDSVKGVNVSGVALKLMFMDAILKVKEKEEIWLDYLMRRVNLLKAILGRVDVNAFGDAVSTLLIEPQIDPYIVIDEMERTNIELALTGNKQLKSQKTAMTDLGIANVEDEYKAIKDEEEAADMFLQNEPTMA